VADTQCDAAFRAFLIALLTAYQYFLIMSNRLFLRNGLESFWRVSLWGLIFVGWAASQGSEPLRVQAAIGPGPYFVGQGLELRVSVLAAGQRPKIDLPRINGARVWMIGTELKPIGRSDIGSIVAEEILFVMRYRVVALRSGMLEVPSIKAQVRDRTGRSQPMHVSIQPVPPEGRPAEFLGGVGGFVLSAEAAPHVVRVGQELDFRIKVSGPAAWGMTGRPDLARYGRLGLGLRMEPEPDEMTEEPPARTFVYRLRPTRAGPAVLPPVAIAAFDPALSRYATRTTAGVPIQVVAVPAFDPASIDDGDSTHGAGRSAWAAWTAWGLSAALMLGAYASLVLVRRGLRSERLHGPTAACRYAARLARSLKSVDARPGQNPNSPVPAPDRSPQPYHEAARRITEELIHYLQLGMGRPTGALTPDEARLGVTSVTGSQDLGEQAARITTRCDLALYRGAGDEASACQLLESARALFEALGRVKTRRRSAR
jgi:hypothetical protein